MCSQVKSGRLYIRRDALRVAHRSVEHAYSGHYRVTWVLLAVSPQTPSQIASRRRLPCDNCRVPVSQLHVPLWMIWE
jgi:hypothetical protein